MLRLRNLYSDGIPIAIALGVTLAFTCSAVLAQDRPRAGAYGTTHALNIYSAVGHPFTAAERTHIVAAILAHPDVSARVKDHRVRTLSVSSEPGSKEDQVRAPERRIAGAVLFDYTTGQAVRVRIDTTSGALLGIENLPGRPQTSKEERDDATAILQRGEPHAKLQADSVVEGGFVVDGPPGSSPAHRFVQLQVLTADRRRIERLVVVDLTARAVVSLQRQ